MSNVPQQVIVPATYNVCEAGAVGDGHTRDTVALQTTINRCAAAGGGIVVVPAGTYLTGTLYLKSHVELHLAPGATLRGSPDRADYNTDDMFPESPPNVRERASGAHLLIAYRETNVAVTGQGTIDGNAAGFFQPLAGPPPASHRCRTVIRDVDTWRPGQMLWFCRCTRVAVRDVRLVDPPYWSLLLLGCEDVQIRGVTCLNPPESRNGDGIGIDCSRNVTVSDCIMRTGDDCLTVRGNTRVLGDETHVCERVAVSNCIFSTPTCAIRVGVGDGTVRHCSFSNIVVDEARTGVCVQACYARNEMSRHGARIEQIHFANFTMNCILPIVISMGPEAREGAVITDISFDSFRVTAFGGAQMIGQPDVPIRRVRLSNVDWCCRGGTDNCELCNAKPAVFPVDGFHAFAGQPGLPAALYAQHIEDSAFENIRLRWEQPSAVWRDGFYFENARGLELRNLVLRQPQEQDGAAIHLCAVEDVHGADCRAAPGTSQFVQVEDCDRPESIRVEGDTSLRGASHRRNQGGPGAPRTGMSRC